MNELLGRFSCYEKYVNIIIIIIIIIMTISMALSVINASQKMWGVGRRCSPPRGEEVFPSPQAGESREWNFFVF